jgi:glycosyltransferase involved in cell wall biosynthesis
MENKMKIFKKHAQLAVYSLLASTIIYLLNFCFYTDSSYSVFQNVTRLLHDGDRALVALNDNHKTPDLWNEASNTTNQEFYQYSLLLKMNTDSFSYSFDEENWVNINSSELTQNKSTPIRNHQTIDFSSSLMTDSFVGDFSAYYLDVDLNQFDSLKINIDGVPSNEFDLDTSNSFFSKKIDIDKEELQIGVYDYIPEDEDRLNPEPPSSGVYFFNNTKEDVENIIITIRNRSTLGWQTYLGPRVLSYTHSSHNNHLVVPKAIYQAMGTTYGFEHTDPNAGIGRSLYLRNGNITDPEVINYSKYVVCGVYDENANTTNYKNLNKFFEQSFGQVVFFEKGYNPQENFDVYLLHGNDAKKNKAIYTEIRPYLNQLSSQLTYPDLEINLKGYLSGYISTYVNEYYSYLSDNYFVIIGVLLCIVLAYIFYLSIKTMASLLSKGNGSAKFAVPFLPFFTFAIPFIFALFICHTLLSVITIYTFVYFVAPIFGLTFGAIYIGLTLLLSYIVFKGETIMNDALRNVKTFEELKKDTAFKNDFGSDEHLTETDHDFTGEEFACFFGMFKGPTNSAGACRSLYVADLFVKNGISSCICCSISNGKPGFFAYKEGIYYSHLESLNNKNIISKMKRSFALKKEIIKTLDSFKNKPKYIVIYSVLPLGCVKYLRKYCQKNNIELIFDVVEFQMFRQQKFSSFFNYYLPQTIINKCIIKKDDKVIVISQYLDKYFKNRGCVVAYIPFVVNNKYIEAIKRDNNFADKIVFIYAGLPNRGRDLLANNVKGFNLLPDSLKEKIVFIVAGITANDFLKHEKITAKDFVESKKYTYYVGRLTHSNLLSLYSMCDFSVLIKPDKMRLSEAGFPTKISESLSYGLPVVCNISSDLALYLTDEHDSFIMKSDSPEEFCAAVKRILATDRKNIVKMRKNAKKTCVDKLDSSIFNENFKKVL